MYKVVENTVNSTRICYRAAAGSDLQKLLQAEKLLHPHAMPVLVYNMYGVRCYNALKCKRVIHNMNMKTMSMYVKHDMYLF